MSADVSDNLTIDELLEKYSPESAPEEFVDEYGIIDYQWIPF